MVHQHFKLLVSEFFYYPRRTLTQDNEHFSFIIITVATDLHHPFPRWTESTVQNQVQRPFMVRMSM